MTSDAPSSDQERLARLAQFQVLDTPAERAFDDLAALAAQICETPMSVVCFVGEHHQSFKARVGVALDGVPNSASFCAETVRQQDVFVVADAAADPRFAANPLVAGEAQVRFY